MFSIQFVDLAELSTQLAAVALLVETLTQTIKTSLKETKTEISGMYSYYLSMVIGVLATFVFGISLFDTENPGFFYVGSLICGLIAARGGNYIFDIVKGIGAVKGIKEKK